MKLKIGILVSLLAISGLLVATGVNAAGKKTTLPGWGYGDTNHVHTGPPASSVHPTPTAS